ncbi:winged helix-turn-helix transcriptional regulator [Priestia megaterium]|nr:winged helix-turn-helix transcriptional regulator [Priestia megaterium]
MKKEDHTFLAEETVEEASRILKAISDPTRMKILYLLFQEECSVGHMAEVLGISQSAISHQLSHLRHLRLVKYRRERNTYFYTYDDEHVVGILHQVIEHIECSHKK